MKGATTAAAGTAGLVPIANQGYQEKFLRGDGIWADPATTGVGSVRYNETTDMVQIYDGNFWLDWKYGGLKAIYLYKNGEFNADLFGTLELPSSAKEERNTITFNENYINFVYNNTSAGYWQTAGFQSNKAFDVTDISKVVINYSVNCSPALQDNPARIGLSTTKDLAYNSIYSTEYYLLEIGETSNSGLLYIDTSNLTGSFYLTSNWRESTASTLFSLNINEIYLIPATSI